MISSSVGVVMAMDMAMAMATVMATVMVMATAMVMATVITQMINPTRRNLLQKDYSTRFKQ